LYRQQSIVNARMSGGIPYAVGQTSVVRIPVHGTNGLCIELKPRGWAPQGGATSTLFFQDATGKCNLRLDDGYNVKTKTVDYHWNQKGTFADFGIADYAPARTAGEASYNAAKYFRYAGRVLVVVGVWSTSSPSSRRASRCGAPRKSSRVGRRVRRL
jgi:hypothetical protein